MTPQDAKLIEQLFDRLASLESVPRDAEAVRAINDGLKRAPNALYPLVQTALVQDEALRRADARIHELEGELGIAPGEPAQQPGFLDSMRDLVLGKPHGSVPTVRPGAAAPVRSVWGNTTGQQSYAPHAGAGRVRGGSFLGTAAATAAGVVGGALLMNSLRGLFGGHTGQGAFDSGIGSGRPWDGDTSDSQMARDAGIDSIGGGSGSRASDSSQRAGLFDSPPDDGGDFDVGGDFGSDGGDTA